MGCSLLGESAGCVLACQLVNLVITCKKKHHGRSIVTNTTTKTSLERKRKDKTYLPGSWFVSPLLQVAKVQHDLTPYPSVSVQVPCIRVVFTTIGRIPRTIERPRGVCQKLPSCPATDHEHKCRHHMVQQLREAREASNSQAPPHSHNCTQPNQPVNRSRRCTSSKFEIYLNKQRGWVHELIEALSSDRALERELRDS
jgi:hypothetical protein